jgi:aspartyl protease
VPLGEVGGRTPGRMPPPIRSAAMTGTPFTYLSHLVTLPVRVGDVEARFVLDTGIGPTILTGAVARRVGCVPNGETFTGRRMSGQQVGVPLAEAPSIALGSYVRDGHVVGVLDTTGFPDAFAAIDGFLSLAFFEERAFTVDYEHRLVVVETPETLAERVVQGVAVPVRLERRGPALDAFLHLTVPGLGPIEVEVDMGSDSLILDTRHAPAVGVRLDDPTVRRVEGQDETGHAYLRCFTRLDRTIHVTGEPSVALDEPDVMFQEIIYDGLIGHAFLGRFTVTYDMPGARMIFGPRV